MTYSCVSRRSPYGVDFRYSGGAERTRTACYGWRPRVLSDPAKHVFVRVVAREPSGVLEGPRDGAQRYQKGIRMPKTRGKAKASEHNRVRAAPRGHFAAAVVVNRLSRSASLLLAKGSDAGVPIRLDRTT